MQVQESNNFVLDKQHIWKILQKKKEIKEINYIFLTIRLNICSDYNDFRYYVAVTHETLTLIVLWLGNLMFWIMLVVGEASNGLSAIWALPKLLHASWDLASKIANTNELCAKNRTVLLSMITRWSTGTLSKSAFNTYKLFFNLLTTLFGWSALSRCTCDKLSFYDDAVRNVWSGYKVVSVIGFTPRGEIGLYAV